MNHATMNSPRLWSLYQALCRAGRLGLTTREVGKACGSEAPGTDVSELRMALRKSGVERDVECRYERMTAKRRKVYRYTLVPG